MNKRELVESIAEQVDVSKQQVEAVLDRFMSTVGATLKKGERLALTGFGTFEARKRAARKGLNPQTGAPLAIKATTVPAFKAGQALKNEVAGSRPKSAAKKSVAKKAAVKKSAAKKSAAKKAPAKKAAVKKSAAKKAPAKKATVKKSAAKKAPAKKAAVKKSAAKKAPAKKAAVKKSARKSTAKKR